MPTVTERLELLIDAKTGGAVSEIRKLNASVDQTAAATSRTGGATGFLQTKLESMGLSAGTAATVLKTAVPLAAGAAGAAIFKFGKDSVDATVNLADGIRHVQEVSGTTADVASRLVAIFDDYGVSAEDGARSIGKLGINLRDGGEKLEKYGVDVVHAKDGTVDFQGTLENIAEAYQNTQDAGERSRLVLDAFGKSGRDLIPILQQGRDGIEKLFANVPKGQILSQEQIDNARQYQLAVDDLQDTLLELKVAIGNALIPTLTQLASTLAEVSRAAQLVTAPFGGISGVVGGLLGQINPLTLGMHAVSGAQHLWNGEIRQGSEDLVRSLPGVGNLAAGVGTLVGVFHKGSDSSNEFADSQKRLQEAQQDVARLAAEHKTHTEEGAEAQRELTAAQDNYDAITRRVTSALSDANGKTKEATGATSDLAAEINAATAAQRAYYDATNASINAQLGLTGAELNVEAAVKAHTDATAENGETSLEARQAQQQLESSVYAAATAAVEAQKQQLALHGVTQTTADAVQAQKDELQKLKEKFPELTPVIDAYLSQLAQVPETKTTTFYAMTDEASSRIAAMQSQIDALPTLRRIDFVAALTDIFSGVTPSRQHGGPIPGGVNQGVPILAHGGEYVLSADVVDRIKRGAPSYGATVAGGGPYSAGSGPQVIQLVVSGRVLAEVTAAEFSRLGGPQMAARAIQN